MDDPTRAPHLPAEPVLHPDVEDQVRALLAGAESHPMPSEVEARVLAALGTSLAAAHPDAPRARRWRGPRPLLVAAAVAGAATVVGAGLGALHLTGRPTGSAVAVVGAEGAGAVTSRVPSTRVDATGRLHIQLSRTAYDMTTLASQARALLTSPGTPLRMGAAESPSLGPIGTEIGLTSCLGALGAAGADAVTADLATYAGQPAAIIVVTTDGTSTAYAVRRHCTTGDAQLLAGPTPVP